jgi:hypothetical protein
MNLKMKAVAVAVAMMAASSAHALIDPFSTGDGELFLSVRDNSTTAPQSIAYDLNVNISAFDGNLSQTYSNSILGDFLTNGSGDYSWAIMAGDLTGGANAGDLNYLTTAAVGIELQIEANETNNGLVGWSAIDSYLTNVNSPTTGIGSGETLISSGSDVSFFNDALDSWQNNSPMLATGALGDSLAFYRVTNSASTTRFPVKNNPVDAIAYAGTWTLSSTGDLTYSVGGAPVPVPAAVWLLGSAMVGLVGVSRRRQQA